MKTSIWLKNFAICRLIADKEFLAHSLPIIASLELNACKNSAMFPLNQNNKTFECCLVSYFHRKSAISKDSCHKISNETLAISDFVDVYIIFILSFMEKFSFMKFMDENNVSAGIITLMSISDRSGPSIFDGSGSCISVGEKLIGLMTNRRMWGCSFPAWFCIFPLMCVTFSTLP